MELRHLRYFVAVAEEQNVTRAAARLHVSQPPLTRQIHDLEGELGFALFVRTAKTVRLTDAGKTFLDEARAILQRVESGVATARAVALGKGGELHVGYAPSPTVGILPPALETFRRHAPGVKVVLHDQSSPEMLAGLRDRSLHLALMMQPPRAAAAGITFEPLRSHAMVVAMAPTHRFARRRNVTLTDVLAETIVALSRQEYPDYHALLARIAGRRIRQLRIAEECDSGMSLIAAVVAGKGVAIVNAGMAETSGRRLRYTPLSPPARAIVGIACLKDALTPLAAAFLDAVRTTRGA